MGSENKTGNDTSKSEKKRLLADFDVPTYDEWREVATKSLKGAPSKW